jgi:dienelactone hydrolase
MHTHGGPNVRFYGNTPHAEIMYFLSQGYIVACPNYRGSINHPRIEGESEADYQHFKTCETMPADVRAIASEDVYAVALHLQRQAYCDPDRITLRGGSYGSSINLILLAGIKQGKFKNIFNGAHISGCTLFPNASDLPLALPLLISHGVKDDIAAFSNASDFMSSVVATRSEAKQNALEVAEVITFVAHAGDHHLICKDLEIGDKEKVEYAELEDFLKLTTLFVHTVNRVITSAARDLNQAARYHREVPRCARDDTNKTRGES